VTNKKRVRFAERPCGNTMVLTADMTVAITITSPDRKAARCQTVVNGRARAGGVSAASQPVVSRQSPDDDTRLDRAAATAGPFLLRASAHRRIWLWEGGDGECERGNCDQQF
jgi:hypothetical protein